MSVVRYQPYIDYGRDILGAAMDYRHTVGRYAKKAIDWAGTKKKSTIQARGLKKATALRVDAQKRDSAAIRNYSGGNDFTRSKKVIRSRRRKTMKAKVDKNTMLIKGLMNTEIYRFQNISNYDTNLGAVTIRNGINTTTGRVECPIHVYDITSFSNESNIGPGQGLGWSSTAAAADGSLVRIPGQTGDGSADANGLWLTEKNSTATPFPAVARALHNWSDIRINFYGPRKRTTYFDVMFIQIKNQFADLLYSGTVNPAYKLLQQYLERPLIYSNLQTDVGGGAHKMFRTLKRMRYYISASQTTDVDTSVGKIKECKIFMKHDRMRNYDWQHDSDTIGATLNVLPHDTADGLDFARDDDVANWPAWDKRVYMVIRAFSPERATYTTADPAVSADRDPSYDIIIRNSFSFVRSTNS